MNVSEKKEWAKTIYIREQLTQKETARRVKVTEKTMSSWVNKEGWEKLRQSIIVTKEEQLRRIYMQIDELNSFIMDLEPGHRFANSKQADTINKLASAARKLETEASIADIIEVSKRFLNWLRQTDFEKAKDVSNLIDAFIKDSLK
jgi:DNA-binding XRE family transcriptional regulator